MPHPPVIIPAVGRGREQDAAATLEGTKRLCERLLDRHKTGNGQGGLPDVILVLSPHHHYVPGTLFINISPVVRGSLSAFGAASASVYANTDLDAVQELATALHAAGVPVMQGVQEDITRDHGSLVPLLNLARTFPEGKLPAVILAGPSGLALEHALLLGKTLAGLQGKRRWALLASGDLSHRLIPGAPTGYSPAGALFDQAIVEALRKGDPSVLTSLSQETRENAGECGLRPVLTLLGLSSAPVDVLSYEGPFGVGYCNALWTPPKASLGGRVFRISLRPKADAGSKSPAHAASSSGGKTENGMNEQRKTQAKGHPYARLARMTVEKHLSGRPGPQGSDIQALDPDAKLWDRQKACFVSIKGKDGSLRGCIGTILPTQNSLKEEIMANAVSAAVRDPRFPPMEAEELDKVTISVDVLSIPEEVREGMELDPKVWGVIVSKGGRRGLLLPDLPGVTSVEQQIAIAAQKAGISNLDGAQIQRFSVGRYYEE